MLVSPAGLTSPGLVPNENLGVVAVSFVSSAAGAVVPKEKVCLFALSAFLGTPNENAALASVVPSFFSSELKVASLLRKLKPELLSLLVDVNGAAVPKVNVVFGT